MTTREPVSVDEWSEAEAYFLGQVIIYDAESIGYFRANAALTWLAMAREAPTDQVHAYMQTTCKMLCARAVGDKALESRYFSELNVLFEALTDEQEAGVRKLTRIVYGPPLVAMPPPTSLFDPPPPPPKPQPRLSIIMITIPHIIGAISLGVWGATTGISIFDAGAKMLFGAAAGWCLVAEVIRPSRRPHGDVLKAPIPDRPPPRPPDPPSLG